VPVLLVTLFSGVQQMAALVTVTQTRHWSVLSECW